jgi:hypothetical protein
VGIATGYGLDGRVSTPGRGTIFLSIMCGPALGPIKPPIQWVRRGGGASQGLKRQGREADHSAPCSAEVKNGGVIPSLPQIPSWRGAELIKDRDNFLFLPGLELRPLGCPAPWPLSIPITLYFNDIPY